jgi:glycosyltransferase involved in cell wall biosynthesis
METIRWNNQQLEPVLITYNRSADLQRTLNAFIEARLTDITLHVLDNASTDDTKSVVIAAQAQWPNLLYHRNQYNIGGNANILRAVEISTSEYSWILGDDDAWHIEDISELCAVLHEGTADIIRLGWLASPLSKGCIKEAVDLASTETMFFASMSMISATIIRRTIITPNLPHAYMGVSDAYPQLVPIMRTITRRPLRIYTVKRDLMTHKPSTTPGYYFGDLEWCSSWFKISRFLECSRLRKLFVGEVLTYMCRNKPGPLNEFIMLIKVALNYKALGIDQWPYLFSMIAYGTGWRGRIASLMIIYAVLPMKVATLLRKIYLFITGRKDKGLQFDQSRL